MVDRTRRRIVASTAAALVFAGCVTRGPVGDGTGADDSTDSPEDSPAGTETATPGPATIDAVDGAWPTEAFDAAGSRYDPDGRVPATAPGVAWTADRAFDRGSVVVAAETVVVVDETAVTAYNATSGERLWHRDFDARFVDHPCIGEGVVYVGASNGVHALSLTDGTARWHVETPSEVNDLVLADGDLYATTELDGMEIDGAVFAFSTAGDERWRVSAGDVADAYGDEFGDLAVGDGAVFAVVQGSGSATSHVAFERGDGSVRWVGGGNNHSTALSYADGRLCAGGFFGNLSAQSTADGAALWEFDGDLPVETIAVVGDTVYASEYSADGPSLHVVREGVEQWTADAGGHLLAAGDGMVLASDEGLFGFDLDGSVRWTASVSLDIQGIALADGSLFVASDGGEVVALTT